MEARRASARHRETDGLSGERWVRERFYASPVLKEAADICTVAAVICAVVLVFWKRRCWLRELVSATFAYTGRANF